MKKIVTISLIALLFAGINANAQIGITHDGQLNRCTFGLDYHNYYDQTAHSLLYPVFVNEELPKYYPNIKTIKIWAYRISYDHINETSDTSNTYAFEIIIEYDSTGKITSSYTSSHYTYNNHFYRESEGKYIFFYDNAGRVSSIKCGDYITKLIYNEKGFLSKIKEGENEYHIIWGNNRIFPQNVYVYSRGNLMGNLNYTVLKNGRAVTCEYNSINGNMEIRRKSGVIRDAKGHIVEEYITGSFNNYIPDWLSHVQDTKYDANGNLEEQLFYETTDLGKRYTDGLKYKYEYVFY